MRLDINLKSCTDLYYCKPYHQFSKRCHFSSIAFKLSKHEFLLCIVKDSPRLCSYEWRSLVHKHFPKKNFLFIFLQFFNFILIDVRTLVGDSLELKVLLLRLCLTILRDLTHSLVFRVAPWVPKPISKHEWVCLTSYLNFLGIALGLYAGVLYALCKLWKLGVPPHWRSALLYYLNRTSYRACEASLPSIGRLMKHLNFMKLGLRKLV